MFCHMCGNQLPDDSAFCNKCGTKLIDDTTQQVVVEPNSSVTQNPIEPVLPKVSDAPVSTVAQESGTSVRDENGITTRKSSDEYTLSDGSSQGAFYKECPDVPDFGAVIGAPLLRVEDKSDSSTLNVIYSYAIKDVNQEKINKFIEIAQKSGIRYDGYDNEIGSHMFSQGNGNRSIGIYMDGTNNEWFLQIFEDDVPNAIPCGQILSIPNSAHYCPRCKSQKIQAVVETNTEGHGGGYGVGKGCLGYLLLGPLGFLCGACGSKAKITTTNKTFFMCLDCGNKFREVNEFIEEKSKESKFAFIAGGVLAIIGILCLASGGIGWGILSLAFAGLFIWGGFQYKKESEDIEVKRYESECYKDQKK